VRAIEYATIHRKLLGLNFSGTCPPLQRLPSQKYMHADKIHAHNLVSIYPRAFLVEVFKVRFRVHLFASDFLDESWGIIKVALLVYIFCKPFLHVLEVTSGDLFLPVGN